MRGKERGEEYRWGEKKRVQERGEYKRGRECRT